MNQRLKNRLALLESVTKTEARMADNWDYYRQNLHAVAKRMAMLVPEEMSDRFLEAVRDLRGDFGAWFTNIAHEKSALPAELSPGVFVRLAVILFQEDEYRGSSMVCNACRLERPHRHGRFEPVGPGGASMFVHKEDYYDACPHCGSSEWTWITLVPKSRFFKE